jgi:AraC-like DNA-binding protein
VKAARGAASRGGASQLERLGVESQGYRTDGTSARRPLGPPSKAAAARRPPLICIFPVVLRRQLSNPSSPLKRALAAYRQLNLSGPRQSVVPRRPVKRATRLTAGQLARLVERYQSGATVYDLAAEFGMHRATVARCLKNAGVTLRLQSPTAANVDDMVRLYASGLSLAAVGERLGFTAETVRHYIQERGVETRDTHSRDRS